MRRLALSTALLLATTIMAVFPDSALAQVFKDDQVCWGRSSACSSSSMDTKEALNAPVQLQKRRPASSANEVRRATASIAPKKPPSTANEARQALVPITHKAAIQVDQNDKGVMDLALNNARNIIEHYKAKGESVAIEIVTYGPGLHMLRSDTSPVKERIMPMALENPNITFVACANTQVNQSRAEGKSIELLSEAKVMPSGVVHLVELQKQGYAYIRP